MFGLKKQLIKGYLSFKVLVSKENQLVLQNKNLAKISDEYKGMEDYIYKLVQILPGVEHIEVDYTNGLASIKYDHTKVSDNEIIQWINTILDLIVTNLDYIQSQWETNADGLFIEMEKELRKMLSAKRV